MRSEDYTNDAVCYSMGIGTFIPATEALRVLLKPSFHPEVCITVKPTRLTAVALPSMLWHEEAFCRMDAFSDEAAIDREAYDRCVKAFDAAVAVEKDGKKHVTLDGVTVAVIHVAEDRQHVFNNHPHTPEAKTFVTHVVQVAYDSVSLVPLRNRLAQCAKYVGLDLPIEAEPNRPVVQRVMILGTPEERSDYMKIIENRKGDRPTKESR